MKLPDQWPQSWGSQQARIYRRARRDGQPLEIAATIAGIPFEEARLHDAEAARSPDPLPEAAYELLYDPANPPVTDGPGVQRNPELLPGKEKTMPKEDTLIAEPENDTENENAALVELAAGTLRGDVRDSMLAWFKAQPKAWGMMSEFEQRNLADAADRFASRLVSEACQLIAANERPCIVATLTEYKEKDGIEAKLKLVATGENITELHKACRKEVLVVTSGFEEFDAEGGPAEIDADQPVMNLGGEYQNQ